MVEQKGAGPLKQDAFLIKSMDNFPKELKKQDLFGMGYPYIIAGYGDYVSVSSDYGLLLFEVKLV